MVFVMVVMIISGVVWYDDTNVSGDGDISDMVVTSHVDDNDGDDNGGDIDDDDSGDSDNDGVNVF